MKAEPVNAEGKHILFVAATAATDRPRKTPVWHVLSKYLPTARAQLGWVAFFPRWRKFSFYPKADTIFEEVCLRDIASFCEQRTADWKRERAAAAASKGG